MNEKLQTVHRVFNTLGICFVLFIGSQALKPLYEEVSGIREHKAIKSEIAQIVSDESYKRCPYKDSLGQWTVGFGHLITNGDYTTCINSHIAVTQLRHDYTIAVNDVTKRYPWASGDGRLLLINMTFNMGSPRLAKFTETLKHFENQDYDLAAGEVLDSKYAAQVPYRAARIAGRIMGLQQ